MYKYMSMCENTVAVPETDCQVQMNTALSMVDIDIDAPNLHLALDLPLHVIFL